MPKRAYYDTIARKWHSVTGRRGGAVKELLLNDRVLSLIPRIDGASILELGCGNGYLLPLVLRRFSGQTPARVVLSDVSPAQLELARRTFAVPEAEYTVLDACEPLPFPDATLDLILAGMLFNELPSAGLRRVLRECRRVLTLEGRLLATVVHPALVESLLRRGLLERRPGGVTTMPGAEGLRLPVVVRTVAEYERLCRAAGLECRMEEVYPTPEVLNARPGLRQAGKAPVALVIEAVQSPTFGDQPSSLTE